MMPLQLLLAGMFDALPGGDIGPYIAGALALVLLIAFCVGFAKGARKVGWGGLIWTGSIALFLVLSDKLGGNLLSGFSFTLQAADGEVFDLSAIIYFALAIVCVLAALLVYGICSLIFRGKARPKKIKGGARKLDAFGQPIDDDDEDFEDDDDYKNELAREMAGPSLIGRFLGGVFCILNVVMVLAVVVCLAVLLIDSTNLKNAFTALYEISIDMEGTKLMPMVLEVAKQWGMDMLALGIMISVAGVGRKRGLMESLRTLFATVGNAVVIVLCLYLPFSAMVAGPEANTDGILYKVVRYFVDVMVASMGDGLVTVSPILGQAIAGIAMAIVASIVMTAINITWRRINYALRRASFLRMLDGSLSCVVYLVIGAVAVAAIWAVLTALNVYGILDASALYSEAAPISQVLHNLCRLLLEPFLKSLLLF